MEINETKFTLQSIEKKRSLFDSFDESLKKLIDMGLNYFENEEFDSSFKCFNELLDLSWQEIHIGEWRDVDEKWRTIYGFSALICCHCLKKGKVIFFC